MAKGRNAGVACICDNFFPSLAPVLPSADLSGTLNPTPGRRDT